MHTATTAEGEALPRHLRALLAHETAMPLLERGCTYAELVVVLERTLRQVKSTMAAAERMGLVSRVRPVDAVTGAPREAIVTLCRQSGTSAA